MRLFIRECNSCRKRIYLTVIAHSREQLAGRIGYEFKVRCPHCGNYSNYDVNDVFAEPGPPAAPAGAILGGLIGLIGGPFGMLAGGGLGTLWGARADDEERKRVNRFNRREG